MIEPPLTKIVSDFAYGLMLADFRRPQSSPYQPGIGPHSERRTVELVLDELAAMAPDVYKAHKRETPYPEGSREKCDLAILGTNWAWFLEIKMVRFKGDNGKPADQALMHLLSPYPEDRSALTDCAKLALSTFSGRRAVLVYGYDFDDRSLDPAIDAFEVLARSRFTLSSRCTAEFSDLVHPVHQRGRAFGWEVQKSA